MEIKTKYNVNDLVMIKEEETRAFRVVGITAKVLAGGTKQIFYTTRRLTRTHDDKVKGVTIDEFAEEEIVGTVFNVPTRN